MASFWKFCAQWHIFLHYYELSIFYPILIIYPKIPFFKIVLIENLDFFFLWIFDLKFKCKCRDSASICFKSWFLKTFGVEFENHMLREKCQSVIKFMMLSNAIWIVFAWKLWWKENSRLAKRGFICLVLSCTSTAYMWFATHFLVFHLFSFPL